ncbi:LysR family transcriptional regulator [Nocardia sp. NPDC058640]|uniref:LysR family transcriptional regulator n=1 Tax=Nocardia sp. NPDC058640 TaxID=3346571 RepID=UPI003653F331
MNWQEHEAFLTLAEELHFGRVADRLAVSRARVSQMIQAMERRVGAPLFERTSRRVTLTPLGTQLRDALGPHHHGILAAVARAADNARGISGVLRVGFTHPLGAELLTSASALFRTRHPGCAVEIREVHLSDRFGPLRRDELDLVFLEFPAEEPDLIRGPVLLRNRKVLVLARTHRLADRDTVCADDLAGETLFFPGGLEDYFVDHHLPAHTASGHPIHRTMTMLYWQEVQLQIGAGNGVAVAAEQAEHYYPRPNLICLPFTDQPPVEYGLVWRASGLPTPGAAFAAALTEVVTPLLDDSGRPADRL